jgi:hypothetical protein
MTFVREAEGPLQFVPKFAAVSFFRYVERKEERREFLHIVHERELFTAGEMLIAYLQTRSIALTVITGLNDDPRLMKAGIIDV